MATSSQKSHRDGTSPEPDSKTRLRLWLRLLKTTKVIEGELRANLRQEFGSTLPRFDVMAALFRHRDGLKMTELSAVLRVSNGNVTGIVDRLADEGMVERIAVEGDRRASRVRLTEQGKEDFDRQAVAHEGWIDQLLQPIEPQDATALSARLEDLIKALTNPKDT